MKIKRQLNAWLQLVRLPNLFTIPGEALCGGVLAGVASKPIAILALVYLLIYMGGLILNDIADFEEDRFERGWRPLAAGTISLQTAKIATIVCYLSGLGLSIFTGQSLEVIGAVALVILMTVFYNLAARKIPFIGWSTIALCRAMIPITLFLASDKISFTPFIYSAGIFLYIWLIAAAAYNETKGAPSFPVHFYLSLTVLACLLAIHYFAAAPLVWLLFAIPGVVIIYRLASKIVKAKEPIQVQKYIGKSIGAVLIFQGTVLAILGNPLAVLPWAGYPLSSLAAKKFKGS